MKPKLFQFDTLSLHGGQRPDPTTGARAVPIYQTTSYVFNDSDHAAALFNLEQGGHIYSRISNPTVAVLEERIAALEGGTGAVATASGQSALFLSLLTLLDSGGHIIASASLYGGSINLLRHTLPRFRITTTFVHPRDLDGFRNAMRPETRLVFGEVIGNPGLEILDLKAVSAIAHEAGVPLLIDATFNTPYLCRPFEWGADLVMHSVTKWMGGHGVAIGGIVVESGRFDWEASGKFPTLTEPYAGYHGINFAEEFGNTHAFAMRARSEGMRDFGPAMSPQNAFYLLQGLETLPVRMDRHLANTEKVLAFLQESEDVVWVSHPNLPDHPEHELAKQQLPKGAGSMISFGIRGGRKAGAAFINAVQLASHLANVGDAKTLVIHPATTTHAQMDPEAMEKAGMTEDLIRLSVGMEDSGDIIEDLRQAFRTARKATGGAA
ncbi:MAG: O-acetylhomoserine aminocarboxypropyltransferase [SAR324 cluster bacterium]|nr:O-acetylhomoserine aminocarboxypropyltransferase [SAR324 cluster bacterium]